MASDSQHAFATVQKIYYPSLCAVGIPANLLTIYTMYSRRCGMSLVARLYLMALAVADTLCLFWGALIDLTLVWLDPSPFWNSAPWCGLLTVLEYGSVFTSTWTVIVFTVERYLVLRTTRSRRPCTQSTVTVRVIVALTLVSHLLALPAYWIYSSKLQNSTLPDRGVEEVPACVYEHTFFSTAVVWFHTLVSGGVPYVLLILFNVLIGQQLYAASSMFTKEQLKSINGVTTRSLARKSILILFAVSFTFVLLTLPRFVTYCILRTVYNHPGHDRNDYRQPINLFADLAIMLQWLNSAINFLLYCVVSRPFRREFLHLLSCRARPSPRPPTSNTALRVYSLQGGEVPPPAAAMPGS
ncbi:probable G-protein coupled receptor 139 [Leucoraja erinacea]|uniref:probable G-protein coupled receptor 139 n=1 Tax=Leucoraja erinaceus TaxID=7782 RepID=UPI002454BBDD|nr:probable G-protein coupled receptor 139 [Leucoraja erinacea]